MANRKDIANIIAYMKLSFPNYAPDVSSPLNTVDVLMDLLGDLSTNTLQTAVKSCCAEPGRAFAPSAGEIRGMAVNLNLKASCARQAGEAWGAIIDSFHHIHPSAETQAILDNPLVRQAIHAMGGLDHIGYSEDIMVERAHWLKIYPQYLARATEDAALLPEAVQYIQAQRQISAGIKMLTDKLTSPLIQ